MDDQPRQKPITGIHSNQANYQRGDSEAQHLKQQVQDCDLSDMRQYLTRTRHTRDWQDRCFLLNLVAPHIQLQALTAACAAEPNVADLLLLLGVYYFDHIARSRGTRVAEKTSEQQFNDANQQIHKMMECLVRVYPLDPEDPTPHVFAIRGLVVFTEYENALKQEYAEIMRIAPACVPAHVTMVNARCKKWGGSHEESLHIARTAMNAGETGSDLPVGLFLAHFLVWQYARMFDKNKADADRYLKDRHVNQELNQALDRWISGSYQARRSSIPYLHHAALWYYLSGDYVRLQRILTLTGNTPYDEAWKQIGANAYGDALQKAALVQEKKTGILGWLKR